VVIPAPPDEPPFEGCKGQWVLREQFEGTKSFGIFHCPKCQSTWFSAHAYADEFKQACKRCKTKTFATYLWENTERKIHHRENTTREDKPHHSDKCEACLAGHYCVKTQSSRIVVSRSVVPSSYTPSYDYDYDDDHYD
jgi:hypothetical protein